ncbi:MAG TPA: hypothetical protein PKN21_11540, partial [Bacteroidales bacterium]|nr:hypothetical protein [Bacteroidales bacterium]
GDSVCISALGKENMSNGIEYKISKYSKNGPKWGPGIMVDEIALVYDAASDKDYYLRKSQVPVTRTD